MDAASKATNMDRVHPWGQGAMVQWMSRRMQSGSVRGGDHEVVRGGGWAPGDGWWYQGDNGDDDEEGDGGHGAQRQVLQYSLEETFAESRSCDTPLGRGRE